MPEKREDVDLLVEKALERWSRVEPDPGLEDRVLARLREEGARATPSASHRHVRIPVTISVSLAAAALVVLSAAALLRLRTSPATPDARPAASPVAVARAAEPLPTPSVAVPPPDTPAAAVPAAAPPPGSAPERRPARPSPRRERFPAPTPLSEQGRLLLAYVESTPLEEVLNHKGLLDPPAERPAGAGPAEEPPDPAGGGAATGPAS